MFSSSLDCLIVDPKPESRVRLKAVIHSLGSFRSTALRSGLADALQYIREVGAVQLVFVSGHLPQASISEFLQAAKNHRNGCDAAYILLLANDAATSDGLTGGLLDGLDGFLLEPYSVNSLLEIVEIADKVRKEHQDMRLRLAFRLLVQELSAQQHQVALLEQRGARAGISRAVLAEMTSVLKELDADALRIYHEVAIEYFTVVSEQNVHTVSKPTYRGISERVRQRLSQKALKELRTALAS